MSNPLTALAKKVAGPILQKVLTNHIRAAVEGKYGVLCQRCYLFMKGHKTVVGLIAAIIFAGMGAIGLEHANEGLLFIAAPLMAVGLLDKGWNKETPTWVTSSALWRFLADHTAEISSAFGVAWMYISTCDAATVEMLARVFLTCASAADVLKFLGGAAIFLGLGDATLKAAPPNLTIGERS